MIPTGLRLLVVVLAGLLVTVSWVTPVVPAYSYDFKRIAEDTSPAGKSLRNLTDEIVTIGDGTREDLRQFEVEPVGGELLWVGVTSRRLHFSTGPKPRLLSGELSRTVNGPIVTADLYPLPHGPGKAVLSVVYRSYAGLTSVVFALSRDEGGLALRRIDRKGGVALRPVGRFLHGQEFRSSTSWKGSVHRYRSAESGYRKAEPVDWPVEQPRLLSATWLSESRWALVSPSGNLQWMSTSELFDTVGRNYGVTNVTFTSPGITFRRTENTERYRLPPAHLKARNVLAVPRNPEPEGGLVDYFSWDPGQRDTLIRLFEYRGRELDRIASVGPLEGRVTDLHVSRANPRQLLWLRTLSDGSYRLEIVDLSG